MKRRPARTRTAHCIYNIRPMLVHIFAKRFTRGCASYIVRTEMNTLAHVLSILHALFCARAFTFLLSTRDGKYFVGGPQ